VYYYYHYCFESWPAQQDYALADLYPWLAAHSGFTNAAPAAPSSATMPSSNSTPLNKIVRENTGCTSWLDSAFVLTDKTKY